MNASLTLDDWLARLEQRHPRAIELGLERVGGVWHAMGAPAPATRVITVGGTNGKGSTVAFIEAAASAAGWRVGTYTSPHLFRYNERVRIDGAEVTDDPLVDAFERIEAARGDTPLTYFETGTLAALWLMARAQPSLDLAVLEVGLGGRLDAVNIVDADVAVVTTVALDHQDWLGDSRDAIGREKAGIARAGKPLLIGERDAAAGLLAAGRERGARMLRLGVDFELCDAAEAGGARRFQFGRCEVVLPPRLPLDAPCQRDNAATALAALFSVAGVARVPDAQIAAIEIDPDAAAAGLARARLPGRLQRLRTAPEVIVDVGHNPQAATVLAQWLADTGGTTDAVFSALGDKDIGGIVAPLAAYVRRWYVAGLPQAGARGLTGDAVAQAVAAAIPTASISAHEEVAAALAAALAAIGTDERVLVFGSFHTVAEAGRILQRGL